MTVNMLAYAATLPTEALPLAQSVAAACNDLLNPALEVSFSARPANGPDADLLHSADKHSRVANEIIRLEGMPGTQQDELFEDLDAACFAALDLATETPATTAVGLRAKLRILVNQDHLARAWPRNLAVALAYDILTITAGGRA